MGLLDRIGLRAPAKQEKPKGRSGTINTQGFLSTTDPNQKWQYPESIATVEEMRRGDPSVGWSLSLVKAPIRAVPWTVEPADDSDEAREVSAFVQHALFDCLDNGFDDFLRRALSYLDFGHSVFEQAAAFEQVSFGYEDGDGKPIEITREAFIIRRLGERLQSTIQKWNPDEKDPSRLASIEQWLGDGLDPSTVTIPAERLVVFTNDQEGDDWRGTSLLRAAWRSYELKQKLEQLEAIAYERSMGVPVVYPPSNATDPQLDSVEDGLRDMRQAESVFSIMPGPKADATKEAEGWLFEIVSISGDANQDATPAIQRHEAALARNVLAEFMRLGHAETGARATGEVQQDPYYQGIEAHVHYIEDVVTERLCAPLVLWNYGEKAKVPRLKAGKIQAKNVQILAAAASSLISAKGLIPDLETENAFRELLDLPKRKPEEGEDDPYAPDPPPEKPEGEPKPGDDPEAMSERGGSPFVLADRPYYGDDPDERDKAGRFKGGRTPSIGERVELEKGEELVGEEWESADTARGKVVKKQGDRILINAGTARKPRWIAGNISNARKPTRARPRTDIGPGRKDYMQRLTKAEVDAVDAYKGLGYKKINGQLRNGKKGGKTVRDLDTALEKGSLPSDTTLYRAMHLPEGKGVGDVFADPAFTSTSTKRHVSARFFKKGGRRVLLRIKAKAGTRGGFLPGQSEEEFLLPRGHHFKLVAEKMVEGIRTFDVEIA